MRVEGSKPVSTNKKSDKKHSAASGFGDVLANADGASETQEANTATLSGITALDGILGLQEVDADEGGNKRQAYHNATLTLDALDELRVALLMGEIPPSLLRRIERFSLAQKKYVIDPAMRAVLDEIELRAAVEIAKIEMSSYRVE